MLNNNYHRRFLTNLQSLRGSPNTSRRRSRLRRYQLVAQIIDHRAHIRQLRRMNAAINQAIDSLTALLHATDKEAIRLTAAVAITELQDAIKENPLAMDQRTEQTTLNFFGKFLELHIYGGPSPHRS